MLLQGFNRRECLKEYSELVRTFKGFVASEDLNISMD
jgi:hypothetical protein